MLKQAQLQVTKDNIQLWNLEKNKFGLWKVMGCLSQLKQQETPIFLLSKHPFMQMLIIEAHKKSGHFCVTHTLCQFRERFWTEKGRQATKKALKEGCYHCLRFITKPFMLPNMAQLPLERLVASRPFQKIGIDYESLFAFAQE